MQQQVESQGDIKDSGVLEEIQKILYSTEVRRIYRSENLMSTEGMAQDGFEVPERDGLAVDEEETF